MHVNGPSLARHKELSRFYGSKFLVLRFQKSLPLLGGIM